MYVFKICAVALITAISSFILRSQKSDLWPLCAAAGGIILVLCVFDYLAVGLDFLQQFTEKTNIDKSVLRIIIKAIGVGYAVELTASAVKDLGFDSVSDKLLLCGKLIIFVMSVPIFRSLFDIIVRLIELV